MDLFREGSVLKMAEEKEVKTFKELGLRDELVEACENVGWKIPSKIQAEAIPHALEGLLNVTIVLRLAYSDWELFWMILVYRILCCCGFVMQEKI